MTEVLVAGAACLVVLLTAAGSALWVALSRQRESVEELADRVRVLERDMDELGELGLAEQLEAQAELELTEVAP